MQSGLTLRRTQVAVICRLATRGRLGGPLAAEITGTDGLR